MPDPINQVSAVAEALELQVVAILMRHGEFGTTNGANLNNAGKCAREVLAALSTSVASGEGWRPALAIAKEALELLGDPSYVRGEWIGDEMVYRWIGAEDFQVIARQALGRIEGILSAPPLPPNVPPVDDAFEVGSRVRPRGGTIQGELLEFNEPCTGALIRWDNGDEVWKALRNLVMIPPVDPTGDAQGLGEINLCPTCGALPCDQTQKLPPPVEAGVPSRADLHDMLAAAYEQGCLDVQANYQPDPDPEFGEAAHDYATSALALFNPSSDGGGRG
jgi:hypothetical protein